MWTALIAGSFGLAGAVIGNLSHGFDLLYASRRARNKRGHQLADARQLAYVDFLANAHRFTSWAWTVDDGWERSVSDEAMAARRKHYDDAWTDFVSSYAAVQVGGPDKIATLATTVSDRLGEFSLLVESRTGPDRPARNYFADWTALAAMVSEAREAFAREARTALGTATASEAARQQLRWRRRRTVRPRRDPAAARTDVRWPD